jgi:hypothetical protein
MMREKDANTDTDGGYMGTGTRVTGKQVRVQRVFPKKKVTDSLLKPVPVYPFTHIYPDTNTNTGHRYGYRRYRTRVHGYGLYPTGFSKPLDAIEEPAKK